MKMSIFYKLWGRRKIVLGIFFVSLLLAGSTIHSRETADTIRKYTRSREFSFSQWTAGAVRSKLGQLGLGASGYLVAADRQNVVRAYIELVADVSRLEAMLEPMLGLPEGDIAPTDLAELIARVADVRQHLASLQPIAESVLQEQVASVLSALGLGWGGAPFPPVAFHFTQPPAALIVSPRDVIRQDGNISLDPTLTLEERAALETQVEQEMDVSALVVAIGGIGIYPTMIQESGSLQWITEVIVHEWVHNYLTLRPLGLLYESSAVLRTMNESTANLLGKEIGRMVLERYYPDLMPADMRGEPTPTTPAEPPAFDFRLEMRKTREAVDAMLAEGEIEQAEAYMEARRQLFWENGYLIRRLNQAYFAFHGAYADEPGGAAGDDPVGEAVRELRRLVDSPVAFLRIMSWMNDYSDLQAEVSARQPGD